MEDIKKRWMQYQLETALQLIELDKADSNEARIKDLHQKVRSEQLSSQYLYDMDFPAGKPEA